LFDEKTEDRKSRAFLSCPFKETRLGFPPYAPPPIVCIPGGSTIMPGALWLGQLIYTVSSLVLSLGSEVGTREDFAKNKLFGKAMVITSIIHKLYFF
jgi:hypothetical protein